jgi:CRP/FNR family transcriptional regulator
MRVITADEFIRIFPLFRSGLRSAAQEILRAGREQAIPGNVRIYQEGDACTAIAFVLSGEIRVYKIGETGREITLYEIGGGETCILNASCILAHATYPANAVAASDTNVLLVPSSEFRRLVTEHEQMRTFVFTLLSQRLATVMELVEEVAFGRMDQRLMDYLIEKSGNGLLETTHQRIANDLGTSREVVSRLLKDFERKHLVKLSRNSIMLLEK